MRRILPLLLIVAACGDDDGGGGTRPNNAAAKPAAAAAASKVDKGKLKPRQHVEDKVVCPVPEKPTGPACEPLALHQGSGAGSAAPPPGASSGKMLADCEPGLYCLAVGATYSCEPCRERDSIRHEFKDRDFAADQVRDPFYSYVIVPSGVGTTSSTPKPEPHQTCKRPDQFVALNYSYQDLKLVGIVAQGTQRKVLMMDTGNLGHIIKRGDCVGKEKAVVKDIGTGYVTFVVEEDPDLKRPATETSVQLHPGGVEIEPQSLPEAVPTTPAAPTLTPPQSSQPLKPAQIQPPPPGPRKASQIQPAPPKKN